MGQQRAGEAAGSVADVDAGSVAGWLEPPQPQDLLLTVLADNVRHRSESVWSGGLVRVLGELGFSPGASRVALSRMARRALITPRQHGRVMSYELSDRVERLLAEGDVRIFDNHEPYLGTELTVLMHTVPEEMRLERNRLGRRLRFRGFGAVQDGTWIAPGDREDEVLALLKDLGVSEYCSLVVGHLSRNPQLISLVERAWDLPALNRRYETFVQMFETIDPSTAETDAEAFLNRTQVMHSFRQFPSLDPGMAGPAFPVTPKREQAIIIFHRLHNGLREQSQRHFDEITSLDAGVR